MTRINPKTDTIDADGADLHHDLKNQPGEEGDQDHTKETSSDQEKDDKADQGKDKAS